MRVPFLIIFLTLYGCSSDRLTETRFVIKTGTGIEFQNNLEYTEEFNPYTYRNFYNGGGVALGDINNDNLTDIYFTGNIVDNKLFLNKGNWVFEDITDQAGVACQNVWSAGATFADINGDGLLDIYVCKSGKPGGANRHNELFINNGDLTFTEKSVEYGLDVIGLSTHAAFFDYDKDGDLDCYLLTNSMRSVGGYDLIPDQRKIPDPDDGGNKFFKNENGKFIDFTEAAGIYTSKIGFGLGITLSDFNLDGWTDLFISNDFFERDYLYLNNQRGGFDEKLTDTFGSISMGSMGADAADLNNDMLADIIVTEMLPATIQRQRSKTVFESWDKHTLAVDKGYHHQFPRNVLQRNLDGKAFLEIGRMAGVSATEWSWGALIFDMDNDGLKDIFISNGIYKDLLDRDYLTYMANEEQVRSILKKKDAVVKELIDIMPSGPVPNCAFRNMGDFTFEETAESWGLAQPGFSNGSAYADLDNDGDLDLVVNNVNMNAFLYENTTDTLINRSIQFRLIGDERNSYAIGAKVMVSYGGQKTIVENYPSRGFESSVDPVLHVGVGNLKSVDSVRVEWPDGQQSVYANLKTNFVHELFAPEAIKDIQQAYTEPAKKIAEVSPLKLEYAHIENTFVDFDRERLLPVMFNNEGPVLAKADVDQDGYTDLYIGGSKGTAGRLFKGSVQGFEALNMPAFEADKISEDTDAVFFDIDDDGDQDLYVGSGGRSFSSSSYALMDRLYINDGKGGFTRSPNGVPFTSLFATGAVAVGDVDRDGDMDLFVGERFHAFHYGLPVRGHLLINEQGKLVQSEQSEFSTLNMVTDAVWTDANGDDWLDLVVVGEWQNITLFINENGVLSNKTKDYGLQNTKGLWNTIVARDFDGDGDIDLAAGNHGLNSFFKGGTRMYVHDFDQNGSVEQIVCHQIDGKYYPVADRNELVAQLPALKKKFLHFKDFSGATIHEMFDQSVLENALVYDTDLMETSLFINNGNSFDIKPLPSEAQYSPTYAIETGDFNRDGRIDFVLGGNQYLVKPQFGRYDANPGWVLLQGDNIDAGWEVKSLEIVGQIRSLLSLNHGGKDLIIVGCNDAPARIYEFYEN